MKIEDLKYISQFNSRGQKTIKVLVKIENEWYWSIAPSGASKSSFEPIYKSIDELDKIFSIIKKYIIGVNVEKVDDILEKIGGKRFEKIGGNLSITISQAVWKYIWRNEEKNIFPLPLSNVIGGGAHGGFSSIQEFLVIPKNCRNIMDCVEKNIEVRNYLKEELISEDKFCGKNDEGALIVKETDFEILERIKNVSKKFGVYIGIDMASTEYYKKGFYYFSGEKYKSSEYFDLVKNIIKQYKIKYVEDPFHERDFISFSELTEEIGKKVLITGDDLYSTNPSRIRKGIEQGAGNSVIIKPNQVGSIKKTLKSVKLVKEGDWTHVVSHRSGETEDPFISELAIQTEAKLMKCSVSGSERFSKWNYLIEKWENVKKPKVAKI